MPPINRPATLPRWCSEPGAFITDPPLAGHQDLGWNPATEKPGGYELNWQLRGYYQFARYCDERQVSALEIFRDVDGEDGGSWVAGTDVGPATSGSLTSAWGVGVIYVGGHRVDFSADRLAAIGETNHLYTASRDTYVGLTGSGEVTRSEVLVGAGAPAAPANYSWIWRVTTSGVAVTTVTRLVPSRPTVSTSWGFVARQYLASATLGDGALYPDLTFNKGPGLGGTHNSRIEWQTGGVVRWRLDHTGGQNLRLDRYSAGGAPLGSAISFDSTGGIDFNNGPLRMLGGDSMLAPVNADDFIIGDGGTDDIGITLVPSNAARLAWGADGNLELASVSYNVAASAMTLRAGEVDLAVVDQPNATFRPAVTTTFDLGTTTVRWRSVFAGNVYAATNIEATGQLRSNTIAPFAARVAVEGGVAIRGSSSAAALEHAQHIGQAGGVFDACRDRVWKVVGTTNTNGIQDINLGVTSAVGRNYVVEVRAMGVRAGTDTDCYTRKQRSVWRRSGAGAITFVRNDYDDGGAGPAGLSGGLSTSGTSIVWRAVNDDTDTINWTIHVEADEILST